MGVDTGSVEDGVFRFAGADVGSGGSVATGGMKALVEESVGVRVGVVVGVGADVLCAGVFGARARGFVRGGDPAALTVVDDPAGTETLTPPALVSTVPEIVTTVVSPFGETATYESDPARITDAMPALRTS